MISLQIISLHLWGNLKVGFMATKEYSNGEVTIVWKPDLCIHSAICAKGLPNVFQPREKPWVKQDAAATTEIINQISKCPSGALSFYSNNQNAKNG